MEESANFQSSVSEQLLQKHDEIAQVWRNHMRGQFEESDEKLSEVLHESLVFFLEAVALSLHDHDYEKLKTRCTISGRIFCVCRSNLSYFTAPRIVKEYHCLREAIFETLGEDLRDNWDALSMILNGLDYALAESLAQYHTLIQGRSNLSL